MKDRLPRKLAAILYADVAGYSRLTGEDEEGTHRRLRKYLDVLSAAITEHHGRVVHYAGDAVLADFGTATEALACAADIQRQLADKNTNLSVERKVEFRIGVNLGEVIEDRDDIYGDGVNVAARLEGLAEPGGICVSESVRAAVGNKLDLVYESKGEQFVKNIAEPIRAYCVSHPGSSDSAGTDPVASSRASEKPSIAVLPFTNMSGDPEQEYFSDGITEDIITDLSRFRMISVASRNSSFSYKNTKPKIQNVAAELSVDYVLEGSVRKARNRIRVTAQLVDGVTANHVWAERYDRSFDDIFDVQDELTRTIVATISRRIETDLLERAQRKPPDNMDAYAYVLQGRERLKRRDRESTARARKCFEDAIKLDPDYGVAWAELAGVCMYEWNGAWTSSPEESLRTGLQYAQKAFSLDPNDPRIVLRLGFNQFFAGHLEPALQLFKRALELNPHDSEALCRVGLALTFLGRHAEAIDHLEQALELDPFGNSFTEWYLGIAYFSDRQYGKSIETLRSCRAELAEVQAWLAAAYGQAGRLEEALNQGEKYLQAAREEMQENQAQLPKSWCTFLAARGPFKRDTDMDHFMEGPHKAGLK